MALVTLRSPEDGSETTIRLGWSWTLFFGSGFFGMALFMRGLHILGVVYLVLAYAHWFLSSGAAGPARWAYLLIHLALVAWIAWRGNALAAHALIGRGWMVVRPRDAAARPAHGLTRLAA